jgi:hypothetical protein
LQKCSPVQASNSFLDWQAHLISSQSTTEETRPTTTGLIPIRQCTPARSCRVFSLDVPVGKILEFS